MEEWYFSKWPNLFKKKVPLPIVEEFHTRCWSSSPLQSCRPTDYNNYLPGNICLIVHEWYEYYIVCQKLVDWILGPFKRNPCLVL